ncbi:hypothetical protein NDU88_004968, partial [Pleurodeles waltl]
QHPSEERNMESHCQENRDPGDPPLVEHSLPREVRGPETLGPEDCGGLAGAVLSTWVVCPSDSDPPTPFMAHILAMAYLELDGCLRAAQQAQ